jgi:hypothetical protein
MILHLLFDSKFGEYAIRQFSDSIMYSEFVLVSDSNTPVNSEKYENVRIVKDEEEFSSLLGRLGDYKAIVLHGLFYPWQERVLDAVPDHVKIAWVFWGGDLYGRQDVEKSFLSASSKCLLFFQNIKRILRGRSVSPNYEIPIESLKRIDYCLTDIPEDFAFAQSYLKSDIKELWYNYYSIEETIGDLVDSTCCGNNVLVGNSCSLTCNHLDGLRLARKVKLPTEAKVYVPLSYGESWLKKAISKWGRLLLGDRFTPLTSFLPREEYNLIIKSCSIVIMPHYRPQAFGNILTALWLGSRVFLSERNELLPFFKRIGAVIYTEEHDLDNSSVVLGPLSEIEREQNRAVISSLYGKEVMYLKNLEIVRTLNQ